MDNLLSETTDQVAIWTLRVLLRTSAQRRFDEMIEDNSVVYSAGITPAWISAAKKGDSDEEKNKSSSTGTHRLKHALARRLERMEAGEIRRDEALFGNIEHLAEMMGLERVERELERG